MKKGLSGDLKTYFPSVAGGVVTAGSASGICDGAGAVVIASEAAIAKHNLTPLARSLPMITQILESDRFLCLIMTRLSIALGAL